jgi:hypothetical protein
VKGSRQVGCTEPGSGMRQGGGEGHDRGREVAGRHMAQRQAGGTRQVDVTRGRWPKAGRSCKACSLHKAAGLGPLFYKGFPLEEICRRGRTQQTS